MQLRILATAFLLSLTACSSGSSDYVLSLKSGGTDGAGGGSSSYQSLDPAAQTKAVGVYDASGSGLSASALTDSLSLGNALRAPSGGTFPPTETAGGKNVIRFTSGGTAALYADGAIPSQMVTTMTFLMVLKIDGTGRILTFGDDETTEAFDVSVSGTQLVVTHRGSSTSNRSRSYDISSLMGSFIVLGLVSGSAGKDVEVYINGFRQTAFTSASTGSDIEYSSIQRNFFIGGSSGATFRLGQLILLSEKTKPQEMYRYAKSLADKWGLQVTGTVTTEISSNTMPPVEPESIDYAYVRDLIFTPKCVACHQSGGTHPYLDSYANVMSEKNSGNQLAVVAGNSSTSRVFVTVSSGYMPMSSPALSAADQSVLRLWIDSGAPQ